MNKPKKPKIRYVSRPYFFGIPCDPVYVCETVDTIATGKTPVDAYKEWDKHRPKTMVGVLIKRLINWFVC